MVRKYNLSLKKSAIIKFPSLNYLFYIFYDILNRYKKIHYFSCFTSFRQSFVKKNFKYLFYFYYV